jgi:hypothetical protein
VCGDPPLNRGADERCGLVQAFVPLAVGIGVGGDAATDAENRVSGGVELDGADRHVQFTARDG